MKQVWAAAFFLLASGLFTTTWAQKTATTRSLVTLQQDFVNLGFGMFIHYNIPTYGKDDWADPDASPAVFNPGKLDTDQWAAAAKSANMAYGCLTTKHHSGFTIWNTKTTDYNVMHSPYGKDIVAGYADSFRRQGLKVMLYYSILDTHHKLRPGHITPAHIQMIKDQLTELLTNYGEITALIIDGWDAPWLRISYDDVPFEEIYSLVKSIQPNCLLMDLNAAKYPAEALFYTDIKSYEQGAGQHISKESNKLPALSCLPINQYWFWKPSFPTTPVKKADELVNKNLVPFNRAYCNFILNVAPNRDGLIDDNVIAELKEIGKIYKKPVSLPSLLPNDGPVIASNLARNKPADSSWGDDMMIMDFANDDDFKTSWNSNPAVTQPWLEIDLMKETGFNTVVLTSAKANPLHYQLDYFANNKWYPLTAGTQEGRTKVLRFDRVTGQKVRVRFSGFKNPPTVAELGIYNERR
ncbi:alpha-L-fucosidase [Dyadobacter sandarakinus]|uniref:alpha-L-fucosidase n=1 Tax=Dyadobacter sandarakinus TaxID=2747268 RepID=A0ABX7I681_9BACT|nr:alpha-L-fucosidase [Dyadobacter sandarakinus]QRR00693.1 alpha-L-fucosidase [Dyadobacter sandarakinus]